MEVARKLLVAATKAKGPKKPPSAYILFGQEMRETEQIKQLNNKDRMKAIADSWTGVGSATRERLAAEADRLKVQAQAAKTAVAPVGDSFPATIKFKTEEDFEKQIKKITDAAVLDFMTTLLAEDAGKHKLAGGGAVTTAKEGDKLTVTWKPPKKILGE